MSRFLLLLAHRPTRNLLVSLIASGSVFVALVPTAATLPAQAAELIPVEDFCRASTLTEVRLSPDGKHMAAISTEKHRPSLLVSDLVTGRIAKFQVDSIIDFQWLTNERLLCYAGGLLYGEIFAVNIDASQLKVLLDPFFMQAVTQRRIRALGILKTTSCTSDSVLVEDAYFTPYNLGDFPHPQVHRLNFFTGKMTLQEKNPGNVIKCARQ